MSDVDLSYLGGRPSAGGRGCFGCLPPCRRVPGGARWFSAGRGDGRLWLVQPDVLSAGDQVTQGEEVALDRAEGARLDQGVAEAGGLGRESALRKACEKAPACATIPCYEDEPGDIARLVRDSLGKDGVGLTGVGGGSLMTPLLTLMGVPLHTAIGTDLLYAAMTKSGGAVVHGIKRNINWRIAGILAAGSIPASLLTLWVLNTYFGDASAYGPILTRALGFMLLLTAVSLIFRRRLQSLHDALQRRGVGRLGGGVGGAGAVQQLDELVVKRRGLGAQRLELQAVAGEYCRYCLRHLVGARRQHLSRGLVRCRVGRAGSGT